MPPPTTATRSPGSMSARATPCQATLAGSTRLASSTASPSGRAINPYSGTRTRSARPPSRLIPMLMRPSVHRWVDPDRHWAHRPQNTVGSTA